MSGKTLGEEIGKRNPFECPEEEVALNLLRTNDRLGIPFLRLFREHEIAEGQYNVLRILRGAGKPLACHEIGGRMVSEVPDVTRLVDRLEAAGLVERSRTETDRRVVLTAITPKGLEKLGALDAPVLALHRAQLGHLSAEEKAILNLLLRKARTPPGEETP